MTRSHLVAAVAALASIVSHYAAHAEELPDDKLAPFQFSGMINSDNVYVRSYSSENDYPVVKLSKGDSVIVVGSRFDYLKILPPAGVYCLVGRAWVEVRGDGSVGRVRDEANNANVRVGSALVPAYGKVVTQVKAGEDVKILGQQEEYFKITPPAGTFVYVHKRFVDPVKRVEVVTDGGALVVKPSGEAPKPDPVTPPLVPVPPLDPAKLTPTTAPADAVAVTPPATQPDTKAALASFDALESKFKAATKLPLGEQPIDELIGGYRTVTADKTAPESVLRLAEYRLAGLNLRRDAAETMRQADASRKQREAAQLPLVAEAREITERMAANEFKRYAAVGTLRTSSLPQNGKTLYRLTDPATGRTVVYVTDAGANLAQYDGQFVGVRGTIADDTQRQIKLLTPQSVEAVDPADLARGAVSGGMVPPSLTATSDASR